MFRLARFWKSLYRVIKIVVSAFASVFYLTLLLALFMFITGLLGLSVSQKGLCMSQRGSV